MELSDTLIQLILFFAISIIFDPLLGKKLNELF
jgi:hypothetical protein